MFGYSLIKTSKLEELRKPKYFYYECKGYDNVCKCIDYIHNTLHEKTQCKNAEIAKQQVWLLDRKDKIIYFSRYNVIRNGNEIIQWSFSEDEPKHFGEKIAFPILHMLKE